MYVTLYKFAEALARWMALLSGLVLLVVVALTCVSIAGRALLPLDIGVGPIKGIYDMTEIGVGAAIFGFCRGASCSAAMLPLTCSNRFLAVR